MNRVSRVGCSGSGKTTLALALAERTGLPVHHLDQLFWKPGWVESKPEDFLPIVTELTKGDRWIIRYRGRVAPNMPPGCVERFEWSFYRWIWNFNRAHRPGIIEKLHRHAAGRRVVILRSRREIAGFLTSARPAPRV